jgi:hypothetical protein
VTPTPAVSDKPALTPAERRRRQERRAWIPSIIFGAIIFGAIVAAVLFQASGVGKPVAASGDSTFNIAGLKVINGAADAQFDVRKPLSAHVLGLPANSSKTFGPFDGIELEVDLVGTSGTEKIFVDSMHVVTRHGAVISISTTTHDFGYQFIHSQILSLGVLGLTTRQMANFEDAMPNGAGDAHSYFSLPFGTGDALGVPTSVSVSCAGPKGCTVSTKTTLRQK